MSSADARRICTAAEIRQGDFIEAYGGYAEVVEIHGPNRKIGDGTVDWYTFRVAVEDDFGQQKPYSGAVGPWRADREVVVWSGSVGHRGAT